MLDSLEVGEWIALTFEYLPGRQPRQPWVEAELRAVGCPKVNLQVFAGNEQALAFWASMGFAADRVLSLGKRL